MSAAPVPPSARTRVAFVGATGRSGSTLLSRVLGSLPGVVSVGELLWIWTYGVLRDRPCGCGQPFSQCPFWTEVGDRAFGGWDHVDPERANAQRRRLTRNSQVPRLLADRRLPADVDEYVQRLDRLYAAVSATAGGAVVVDNSKQAAAALLARRAPGVELSVVHLVRRSHGVAYSWTKHVERADKGGRDMRRRPPARTAARWVLDNALFELLGRTGTPRALVRYEDFVAAPRAQTEMLARFLDLQVPPDQMPFPRADAVELAADHSVWGNPMRLRTGVETLRPDDAWRESLSPADRRTVTAVSLPGLLRYGYVTR